MNISEKALLAILADGQYHSGQKLAKAMGVSRTAVWKHLGKIRQKDIEITAVRGKGYCLSSPVELLDKTSINSHLEESVQGKLASIELFYELNSTNEYLRSSLQNNSIHANIVFAEYQTGGKGRGVNQWLSGLASGLCMSIGWRYESVPRTLSALSLATGVVLAHTIQQLSDHPIQLKWPNDLVCRGAKLGGILIESRGQLAGSVDLIIGIGLNIDLPGKLADTIQQDVTDLTTVFGYRPSRNHLAGIIINNMIRMLDDYPTHGFEPYIADWRRLDYGQGKNAVLHLPHEDVRGEIVDIDENGCLLMSIRGKLVKYSSGDLSLRVIN